MKKKILSAVLAFCMLFGSAAALPEGVFSESTSITASAAVSGKYEYEAIDNKTVRITKYNGEADTVIIPSKLGGKTVTEIGEEAFKDNDYLVTLKIPDTVKVIGESAFQECESLAGTIVIPKNCTLIDKYAFYGCISIRKVSIPAGAAKEIGDSAFYGCENLRTLELGNSITRIGEAAFYGCKKLGKLVIPDSVKEMGNYIFGNCTSLEEVVIGKGLTEIRQEAFSGCKELEKLTIGSNVTSIGKKAFSNCFSECKNTASLTIPSKVGYIGEGAFESCTNLGTVTFKDGAKKTISCGAFISNKKLTTINWGSSVKEIYGGAFAFCTGLTKVVLPDNLEALRCEDTYGVFEGCTNLKEVVIGSGTTTIESDVFEGCTSLQKVKIGRNVKTIGAEVFRDCKSLTEITIPDKVTEIGANVFCGCSSLKRVFIISGELDAYVFWDCPKLSEVYILDKTPAIGSGAFHGCDSLNKIVIPKTVSKIDDLENEELVINCYKDSAGLDYAEDNGIKYKIVDNHNCAKDNKYATTTLEPTCYADGYTYKICKVCGKYTKINKKAKTAHKFSAWKTTKKATCTADGVQTRKCTVCGKTESKTIAKTGHKFSAWKTTSFDFAKKTSTQTRKCSVCGKKATQTTKNAITRLAGANRYDSAAVISKTMHKTSDTVIVATGLTFNDALVAVPLASAYDAPLLLATEKHITAQTEAELKRLGAKNVIVVSTNGSIGEKAKAELSGYKTTYIEGKTSFETAAKVAKALQTKTKKAPTTIFFATDSAFADALSASPIAAIKNAPILYLKNTGSIDKATADYLKSVKGKVKNAYIIGGDGVISNAMMKNVAKVLGLTVNKTVQRVAGANRYETCVAVNKKFKSTLSGDGICVAKGLDFPDALAGGVYAAATKQALFLADGKKLQDCQNTYLKGKNASKITVFGGTGAVDDELVKLITTASV